MYVHVSLGLVLLFSLERCLFFYFEYGRLAESQINDVVSVDSCNRLNYKNIARDHVAMCDAIHRRLHTSMIIIAASNTVTDTLYQLTTLGGVVGIFSVASILIMASIVRRASGPTVLPVRHLKNE
jgi:hypothetical protein